LKQVRLNWKFLRLAMLATLGLSLTGCGGVNLGGSVSPATFFLPGVMNTVPAPKTGARMIVSQPAKPLQPSQQLAQAR
jgi:hypothetical protein